MAQHGVKVRAHLLHAQLQQLGQLPGHAERLVLEGARQHVLLAGQLEAHAPAHHVHADVQRVLCTRLASKTRGGSLGLRAYSMTPARLSKLWAARSLSASSRCGSRRSVSPQPHSAHCRPARPGSSASRRALPALQAQRAGQRPLLPD